MRDVGRDEGSGRLVAAAFALIQTARLLRLSRLTERELVQRIPDDAFYYLVLARNFALHGRWTFDGVEPASGFQVLWGYLLAAMYRCAPDISLRAAYLIAGAFQTLCTTAAVWLVCRTARRIFGTGAEAGVAVVALSTISLMMNASMMETALVALMSALVIDRLCRVDQAGWLTFALLLGLAGTLARVDFLLLPIGFLLMQYLLWRTGSAIPGKLREAAGVCAGAAGGLAFVALHTHWIGGQWMQSSVRLKLLWGGAPSLAPVLGLLVEFFDPSLYTTGRAYALLSRPKVHMAVMAFAFGFIALVLLGLAGRCFAGIKLHRERTLPTSGLCLAIVLYAALYRADSAGLQQWYIAQLEVPQMILVGGGLSFFLLRFRKATLTLCAFMCLAGVYSSCSPLYYWQQAMYEAALYVRDHPDLKPVGSWNAGLMGYVAQGGVVNLDGLVNDSLLPYAREGRLLDYVQRRNLKYIFDYPLMFSPVLSERGGYGDGRLRGCVDEQAWQRDVNSNKSLGKLRLYRVKPECGGSAPQ